MKNSLKARIVPVGVAFIATALFLIAAEAEARIHLLAAGWFILASAVLMLAICRFAPLGHILGLKYTIGAPNGVRSECDDWGVTLTASLIVTGLALLYFLD